MLSDREKCKAYFWNILLTADDHTQMTAQILYMFNEPGFGFLSCSSTKHNFRSFTLNGKIPFGV